MIVYEIIKQQLSPCYRNEIKSGTILLDETFSSNECVELNEKSAENTR